MECLLLGGSYCARTSDKGHVPSSTVIIANVRDERHPDHLFIIVTDLRRWRMKR